MLEIYRFKNYAYRESDTCFILQKDNEQIILDFDFYSKKFIAAKIACSFNDINIDKLHIDELNKMLKPYNCIYNEEFKTLKIKQSSGYKIISSEKLIKSIILGVINKQKKLKGEIFDERTFDSAETMNSFLNEYGIPSCFTYDDYAYHNPKLNGYEE